MVSVIHEDELVVLVDCRDVLVPDSVEGDVEAVKERGQDVEESVYQSSPPSKRKGIGSISRWPVRTIGRERLDARPGKKRNECESYLVVVLREEE